MIQVIVSGSVFYETDDILIAEAVKKNYQAIGWKDVSIRMNRMKGSIYAHRN